MVKYNDFPKFSSTFQILYDFLHVERSFRVFLGFYTFYIALYTWICLTVNNFPLVKHSFNSNFSLEKITIGYL